MIVDISTDFAKKIFAKEFASFSRSVLNEKGQCSNHKKVLLPWKIIGVNYSVCRSHYFLKFGFDGCGVESCWLGSWALIVVELKLMHQQIDIHIYTHRHDGPIIYLGNVSLQEGVKTNFWFAICESGFSINTRTLYCTCGYVIVDYL